MTRRAIFSEDELKCAIRAADASGKVAVQTRLGIAFVSPDSVAQTAPGESDVDRWFRDNGDDQGHRH